MSEINDTLSIVIEKLTDQYQSQITDQKDMISSLNDTIHDLNKQMAGQNAVISSLQNTIDDLNAQIAGLPETINYLTRKLYGTSSKKTDPSESGSGDSDNPSDEYMVTAVTGKDTAVKSHTRKA